MWETIANKRVFNLSAFFLQFSNSASRTFIRLYAAAFSQRTCLRPRSFWRDWWPPCWKSMGDAGGVFAAEVDAVRWQCLCLFFHCRRCLLFCRSLISPISCRFPHCKSCLYFIRSFCKYASLLLDWHHDVFDTQPVFQPWTSLCGPCLPVRNNYLHITIKRKKHPW